MNECKRERKKNICPKKEWMNESKKKMNEREIKKETYTLLQSNIHGISNLKRKK